MRPKARNSSLKKYYYTIGICLVLILLLEVLKSNTVWVERYYSQVFYPFISYLHIILFSWVPFSVGDLFYAIAIVTIFYQSVQLFSGFIKWDILKLKKHTIYIITIFSLLYTLFYLNWGLNYYRLSVAQKLGLKDIKISKEAHLEVLEKYITIANELREKIDMDSKTKIGVKGDLTDVVVRDTLLNGYLIKSQVCAKNPISSEFASYFSVSGYFNPYTLEVQVNQLIPNASYPFVNVHELAHQMGVGFEDECNFIAFLILNNNDDLWYKYSAYYSAIEYLLQPLNGNKELFETYKAQLSPKVLADFRKEREFWLSYRGWIDRISGIFYNQFLKHNNQPEGIERYSMMATLLIALEKKQEKLP